MPAWKIAAVTAALLVAMPQYGKAQQVQKDYPNKPIRIVVPYAAGGPMDFTGRTIGQKISAVLGQNLIIDNRPGAGGAIGADYVAKSPPDGYTMLHTSSSHASIPAVSKSLPYDSIKDFAPITQVASNVGFIMAARSDLPAKSVQQLVADAKANPGKYTYGSGGVGNIMQFAAEYFNNAAGTQITHVPYKGVGQAITDLIGGRIDLVFASAPALLPHIQSGRIKALGLAGVNRWDKLPDVPTIDEAGLKGFKYMPWYGFWFPARTPKEYVTLMRNEVVKALQHPDVKLAFSEQGFVAVGSTPEEFAKLIAEEIQANTALARRLNISQ
ncbi:MAG: tripartite tricarboxylate transporter substrate binding protein [Betaproteobacteria bacterium]|nr:MAG: tripartite tricarboxylate transporter substrate binding protein [Betaproteobacteria bacterium]